MIYNTIKHIIIIFIAIFLINTFVYSNNNFNSKKDIIGYDLKGNKIYQSNINNTLISYKIIGSGPNLLLITGAGTGMGMWPEYLISELSKNYRLILYDHRGIGHSSYYYSDLTIETLYSDLIELLSFLEINKTSILSYSMGTILSQELIIRNNDILDKVVLYATTCDGFMTTENLKNDFALKILAQFNTEMRKQIKAISKWKSPISNQKLNNKILIIIGSNDKISNIDCSKKLHDLFENSSLIIYENASHFLMREYTEEFTNIVLNFLLY